MNVLFVCTANVNRSVTAQLVAYFVNPFNCYESAGSCLFACRKYGGDFVTKQQLETADVIHCMEERNKREIESQFGTHFSDKIKVANIPDEYRAFEIQLIFALMDKIFMGRE